MRIPVDAIPRTGRTVAITEHLGWARAAVASALEAEPTRLEGRIQIEPTTGPRVDLYATVSTSGMVDCDRCGERFPLLLDTEATLCYLPRVGADDTVASSDDEVELAEDELEMGWYSDGEIDLGDVVQELVALALPTRYVCTDQSACDTRTEALLATSRPDVASGHPGFAALRGFTNKG